MLTFRLGWRNLKRNKRRTAITLTAIALTTAILIVANTFIQGMRTELAAAATSIVVGDAQIHARSYRAGRSFYDSLASPQALIDDARRLGMRVAPRSYGFGLVSCGTKSSGARLIGVDPAAERQAFRLAESLFAGEFLAPGAKGGVVLGQKLAHSLEATVGSEIVAVVQGADGSLGNEVYRVVGVLKIVGDDIDRGAAFLTASDFESLFVSGGRVHEIAINAMGRTTEELAAAAERQGALLESWQQLLPTLSDIMNMVDAMVFLFAIIFLLTAGLGVLNTMLMATHDRVRELGVLKALGASPLRIVGDIVVEGFVLGLAGTVVGVALGLTGALLLVTHGLDLRHYGSTVTYAGIAWEPILRGELRLRDVVLAVAAMWIGAVVASLYPGIKVARLPAARAMTQV